MVGASRIANQDEALARMRKRQIFLALTRVLARKSFHEATVKEIALEAGLAAGSIYVYLKSKAEILLVMVESMVGEVTDALPEIRARTEGDPRRELLGIMRAALDVIGRYPEAFAVINHEAHYLVRRPEFRAHLMAIVVGYKSALKEALERGRAMGVIHYEHLPSAVEAIHMLCSGLATGGDQLARIDKETYWREITGILEGRFFNPAGSSEAIARQRAATGRP
ncbi:MAG: TetR/AcrR family transcriptional regulator [Candidatus Binataceae bacterium]